MFNLESIQEIQSPKDQKPKHYTNKVV